MLQGAFSLSSARGSVVTARTNCTRCLSPFPPAPLTPLTTTALQAEKNLRKKLNKKVAIGTHPGITVKRDGPAQTTE